MDDLAFIQTRIPHFAAYADERARHLADQQVRAFVGETLGMVRARLESEFNEELSALLERILLRCEFSDPKFIIALEQATLEASDVARLYAADRSLIEAAIGIAEEALTATHEHLAERLAELERLFEARGAVLHPWV